MYIIIVIARTTCRQEQARQRSRPSSAGLHAETEPKKVKLYKLDDFLHHYNQILFHFLFLLLVLVCFVQKFYTRGRFDVKDFYAPEKTISPLPPTSPDTLVEGDLGAQRPVVRCMGYYKVGGREEEKFKERRKDYARPNLV